MRQLIKLTLLCLVVSPLLIALLISTSGCGGTSQSTSQSPPPSTPTIASLRPSRVNAGSEDFLLTVNGTNFVSASVIAFNNLNVVTSFVSATELSATVPAGYVAAPGQATIVVRNPKTVSAGVNFTINNSVPVVSSMSATSATAGWPGIPLLIEGSGLISGATMQWNGSDRPSTTLSGSLLKTAIPLADLAQPGNAEVTVFNPAAGGGTSNATLFTIEAVAPGSVGVVERSSVATDLSEADSFSTDASMNSDGRYLAFGSDATNLAGGNRNFLDVFLRDTCVGAPADCTPSVSLISVTSQGQAGNGGAGSVSISSSGRFVAFSSSSTNLVSGDTNRFADVFVRDTCISTSGGCTPTTTMVSLDSAGDQILLDSRAPSISADGRFVAFESGIAEDYYTRSSLLNLRDTCTGAPPGCTPITSRIDVGPGGEGANANSFFPIISASGRYVAFQSTATNLVTAPLPPFADYVFLRDTCVGASGCTPSTTLVSVDRSGTPISPGALLSAMSADGRFVVFVSTDGNVVQGDTNGFNDVFVRDTCNGAPSGCVPTNRRVSLAEDGAEGNDHSYSGAIRASARFIAFSSFATNLVPGDTNQNTDVFLRDTCIGATGACMPSTVRLSIALDGTQSDNESVLQGITTDGRHIVMVSWASTLAPSDTNSVADVFLVRTDVP